MPLLFRKKPVVRESEITLRSGWPVRLTDLDLEQDYPVERKGYPEIYLVTEGTLLHSSPSGRQSLRTGSVVVAHAGFEHGFAEPDSAKLISIGFLPEWLAGEFDAIQRCPDLFSLIFVHCWLDYPTDRKIFVFSLPEHRLRSVLNDIDVIQREADGSRYSEPLLQVTFMKILLQLANEYGNFWRQSNRIELREETHHALRAVEAVIAKGESLRLKTLEPAIGMSIDHFGRTFKKSTGSTLVEYAQRRRAHHAAHILVAEPDLKATAVARRLGFTDSAHLSKSFQKFFGLTPNSYRDSFGAGAGKTSKITPIINQQPKKKPPAETSKPKPPQAKSKGKPKAGPPPVPGDA